MYPVSEAFHQAVANGNEQKALLIFSDCVFTDDDISVDQGIEYHDNFNMEEDLSIGQALSKEISFSLFNDYRDLNDYEFGDFLATIGVKIDDEPYMKRGIAMVVTNYATYVGNAAYPFITRNGSPIPVQPSFAVRSILAYDGKVWCFSDNGLYAVYNDKTGENITNQNPLNNFMKRKSISFDGKGMWYDNSTRLLFIYENGTKTKYEFCPLGWFTAERPKAPDTIRINMTCYDFMQRFDEDMPKASDMGVSYPTTIGNLLDKLCSKAGVKNGMTGAFINSDARIAKEPDEFSSSTMREVLKWIAEAAASNAVINRDGKLELRWLTDTRLVCAATDYSEFERYWYETKKITKLYNRDTSEGTDRTVGTGDEGYLIQDNPLLKGVR